MYIDNIFYIIIIENKYTYSKQFEKLEDAEKKVEKLLKKEKNKIFILKSISEHLKTY